MTSSIGTLVATRHTPARTARISIVALALAQTLIVSACSSNGDSPFAPTPGGSLRLEDFVASASVGGSQGQVRSGLAPTSSGGPAISVSGNQIVVNGGSTELGVVAGSPFTRLFVTLAGESLGLSASSSSGIGNYYEIELGGTATSADLLLTFPQSLPIDEFDVFFAGGDETGQVGPFARLSFDVLQVGTGDVQVTLAWDADSDVDLHVIDPNGEEVYWANTMVPSGGELDLDSNAGCLIDGVRNENITWPEGQAPQGKYTVRVDYWSSCGVASTDYTVVVNNGGSREVFSGTFVGDGDGGGAGSGVEITSFVRTTGPAAISQGGASGPPTVGLTRK